GETARPDRHRDEIERARRNPCLGQHVRRHRGKQRRMPPRHVLLARRDQLPVEHDPRRAARERRIECQYPHRPNPSRKASTGLIASPSPLAGEGRGEGSSPTRVSAEPLPPPPPIGGGGSASAVVQARIRVISSSTLASSSFSSSRYFTKSPMLTSPTSSSPSSTGRWRMRFIVISPSAASIRSSRWALKNGEVISSWTSKS